MFTSFCRSSAAPAFTSSETTSVLPLLSTATISGEFPYCMMEQTCVVRLLSEGTCTCTIKASSSICHIVPYHLTPLNHTYSYIHTQSHQQLVTHVRSESHTALLSDGISATCLPYPAGPVQPQPPPVVKQLQSYHSWQPPSVESFPSV